MKTISLKHEHIKWQVFFLPLLMAALASIGANAQSTLNATGGTGTIGGDTFSYSIGEMVLVNTFQNSNFAVTQGLLQGPIGGLGVEEVLLSEGLEIYPNPVENVIHLQPSFDGGGELSLRLYDLQGRLIVKDQSKLQSGTEKQSLDVSILQEGTYLLQATWEQDSRVYKHSFKLLKRSNQ